MPKQHTSPKLQALSRWERIDEVNEQLDSGRSPNAVCRFINASGFRIGAPLVYEYARLRKKALVAGINMKDMVGIAAQPVVDRRDPTTMSSQHRLHSEVQALDSLIERGYNKVMSDPDVPVSPSTMMAAIKLKWELTDGETGLLTPAGIQELRDVERGKYQLLMDHLVSYIPEGLRDQALSELGPIEDSYYRRTQYYPEYVRALGLDEAETRRRLDSWYSEGDSLADVAQDEG